MWAVKCNQDLRPKLSRLAYQNSSKLFNREVINYSLAIKAIKRTAPELRSRPRNDTWIVPVLRNIQWGRPQALHRTTRRNNYSVKKKKETYENRKEKMG
jgi:hypothetical protein